MLVENNYEVFFTIKDKDVTLDLIRNDNFEYKCLDKHYGNLFKKITGLISYTWKLYWLARLIKPDLMISIASISNAMVAFLLRKPSITFEDTENLEQVLIYKIFTDHIITPVSFRKYLGRKHIYYPGFHELAYLHPKSFNNESIDNRFSSDFEKLIIVRFVSWNASHDIGHKGISVKNKLRLVNQLSEFGKVVISSEKELNNGLKEFMYQGNVDEIHQLLSKASLLFGESATMASEAAMLGVPAIYIDNKGRGYTDELEIKYGLVFNFSESEHDFNKALKKAIEILEDKNSKTKFKQRQQKMLSEKIDVTAFLFWLITHYPQSITQLKTDPKVFDPFFSPPRN